MILFTYLIWVVIGSALAFVVVHSQRWSTLLITPDSPRISKWLIVGGAVIRWILIFIIFVVVLSKSIIGLLIVFFTFLITRIIMLLMMENMPRRLIQKIAGVKDQSWRQ